ncbi:MAG: tRNA methyl transferase PRC-barrel domain-containing protein [Candidatus Eisenbacteria bacterium]
MARILVALSGGVDSAIAAQRLKAAGHEVGSVTLDLLPGDATLPPEVAAHRLDRAAAVARRLGIAHEVWDYRSLFESQVIAAFVEEYAAGRTPNPCVLCNERVKFAALWAQARARGWERLATGHCARKVLLASGVLEPRATEAWDILTVADAAGGEAIAAAAGRDDPPPAGRFAIARARDSSKDQSYMLWRVDPDLLAHVEFPLGALTRKEVEELAGRLGLAETVLPASQDLCFVGAGGYPEFLARRSMERTAMMVPGPIVDADGRTLGRHRGLAFYTIGQRRGLGVGSPSGRPLFVTGLDVGTGTLRVGEANRLFCRGVEGTGFRGFFPPRLIEGGLFRARIRYRQEALPGRVLHCDGKAIGFRFERPVRAIAPGQSLVLYAGEVLVGGAFIAGCAADAGPARAAAGGSEGADGFEPAGGVDTRPSCE